MKKLAPIALFAYNRVDHVKKTVEALLANDLVAETELYIFCDGPRQSASDEDLESVRTTRSYLNSIDGFSRITIKEHEFNLGLNKSILFGINEVFQNHETLIIVEDDVQTSPWFLNFMNKALDVYREDDRVMSISGYWFPVKQSEVLPETFFMPMSGIWGWATWRESWLRVDFDFESMVERIEKKEGAIFKLNLSNTYDYFSLLKRRNSSNEIFSWDVFWHAAISINDGYSLFPNRSLVNNIGQDSSGTHREETKIYSWDYLKQTICVEPQQVELNAMAYELLVDYFKENNSQNDTPIWKKVIKRIVNASKDKK